MSQFRWPGFDSLRRLSPEETADLAARVAELSKAGLPLGEGLRGLAAESSSRRLSRVLHSMADDLDAGADLAAAIDSQGRRLPPHLRGLILAGLRTGRLAEALEEYVDLHRSESDLRHRLWAALAYPLLLLAALTLLAVLAGVYLIPAFAAMFRNFNVELPTATQLVIQTSGPVALTLVLLCAAVAALVLLTFAPRVGWTWRVMYRLPMIGRVLRDGNAAQFARLTALLLGQEVPLPDAFRLAAAGLRDPDLSRGCRRVAEELDRGRPLAECMACQRAFPPSMVPLVQWGQQAPALAQSFRSAADMFEGRVRASGALLEGLLPPLMLVLIVITAGAFVVAMMLPMLSLIGGLSGGGRRSSDYGAAAEAPEGLSSLAIAGAIAAGILLFALAAAAVFIWEHRRTGVPYSTLLLGALRLFAYVWIVLVLLAGLFALLGVPGPLMIFIIAFVVIDGIQKCRVARQYALLWLLTISAERSIPLGPAVDAFARERGGRTGRRARRLAELLDSGVSLPAALRQTPGLLMSDATTLVQIGQQSGAVAAALRQAASVEGRRDATWTNLVGKIFYLALLPSFGFPVVLFVMVWIIPKFQVMFRNFGVELPELTCWLIGVSDWLIDYWYLPAPFVLAAGVLFLYMILRYFRWLRWDPPGISRLVRRLDSARILDCLAIVAAQRKPLGDGIGGLAQCYPKAGIRRRLARAAVDVGRGRDWAESLYDRRLIRSADRAVLQAAQRAGNLPWAMAEMADSNRRRFAYRLQAVVQSVFPLAVIGFGLVVMFIVVGLFYPLVELIKKLA